MAGTALVRKSDTGCIEYHIQIIEEHKRVGDSIPDEVEGHQARDLGGDERVRRPVFIRLFPCKKGPATKLERSKVTTMAQVLKKNTYRRTR
jgi:hypothetical protein